MENENPMAKVKVLRRRKKVEYKAKYLTLLGWTLVLGGALASAVLFMVIFFVGAR